MPLPGISPSLGGFTPPPLYIVGHEVTSAVNGGIGGEIDFTATLPAGVLSGDLLIAVMSCSIAAGVTSASTWTGDSGWEERIDANAAPNVRVATKTAGGSEGNPEFTYTYTGSGTGYANCTIYAVRNAVYDTIGTMADNSVANTTISYNDITLSASGLVIAVIAASQTGGSAAYGTPSGFTAGTLGSYDSGGGIMVYQKTFYQERGPGATSGLSSTIADQSGTVRNAGVLVGARWSYA